MKSPTTYKDAGVDITAGNELVHQIKGYAQSTCGPEVLSGIGGFSGLFSLENINLKKPVLVAATDGVGTKLKLAIDYKWIDHVGQDLVAMCVNDLICCGAKPLFFLDYLATSKLDPDEAAKVIKSIATCLKDIQCTLLGGETAEMPGFYQGSDFDLAGFSVGIVDKDNIINGNSVSAGDKIIGLASSGLHSNGFSLVRKIIRDNDLDLDSTPDGFSQSLGKELLTPTQIYVSPILKLLDEFKIQAMSHITGGGLLENLPRVFPHNLKAIIHGDSFEVPNVFQFLAKQGNVTEAEMLRVFNMGIGFALIVKATDETAILAKLDDMKIKAFSIGEMIEKKAEENSCISFV